MGLTFVDLFSGIGTIRLGMEQAGHKCVYSVEWDKHKRKIYSIIFGGEPEGADIRAVRHTDIPRADVWAFGAPCQDFSIAGKRAGMEGERSSLVLEVFRLVRETEEEDRPKYLLYENVKGMLSSNGGRDFLGILSEMASLGYDFIEYSLLNSKDFGVPQNRERVFTIGHLRGRSTRKIFPITEGGRLYNESGEDSKEAYETALCVTAKGQSNWTGSFIKCVGNLMPSGDKNNSVPGRVYDAEGISPCLRTPTGGKTTPIIISKQDIHGVLLQRKNGTFGKISEYPLDGIRPTITATCYKEPDLIHKKGYRIRKLTPKECWRLQGIPDEITDKVIQAGISDSQMYRGAGDACTTNVIYEIAKKLT